MLGGNFTDRTSDFSKLRQIEREPPGTPEKQKLARLQGNIDENNPKTTDLQLRERKAGLSGASRWWGVQADHSIRHSVPSMRCHLRGVPAAYKSLKSQGPPYTGRSFTVSRVRATTCSYSSSPLKRSTALKMDIHANRHPMNRSTASRNLSLPRSKTLGSQFFCQLRSHQNVRGSLIGPSHQRARRNNNGGRRETPRNDHQPEANPSLSFVVEERGCEAASRSNGVHRRPEWLHPKHKIWKVVEKKGRGMTLRCLSKEVQVSIPRESDLLNNYADYGKQKKELQEIFNMVQLKYQIHTNSLAQTNRTLSPQPDTLDQETLKPAAHPPTAALPKPQLTTALASRRKGSYLGKHQLQRDLVRIPNRLIQTPLNTICAVTREPSTIDPTPPTFTSRFSYRLPGTGAGDDGAKRATVSQKQRPAVVELNEPLLPGNYT
ncbi:hypothetical protein YC2023_094798 [Brassica napus]